MSENGWAEVIGKQTKSKIKAATKAEITKREDAILEQENEIELQEMKELYTTKVPDKGAAVKKLVNNNTKRPTTPTKTKITKPEQKAPVIPQKPKHKDIEHAFRALNILDFVITLESVTIHFNGNHLILLRAITSYLNENLRVTNDDPIYSNKSIFYPNDVIPPKVRKEILKVIMNAGMANYEYFFDLCLSNMADDMNKGLRYLGYKVILQIIAKEEPLVCSNSLARSAMLRNSYQNKSHIGLTILWALGQGGYYDLNVGLKIWQNIMVPVLDSKHYTNFVFEYLYKILKNYSTNSNTYKVYIPDTEFYTVYNLLTNNKKIPKQYADKIALFYVEAYIRNVPNSQKSFIQLLENIDDFKEQHNIRHGLMWCIIRDLNCLELWKQNFRRLSKVSTDLLEYIDQNLRTFTKKVVTSKALKDFLFDINEVNNSKLEDKLIESDTVTQLIKQIQEKTSKKNKGNKSAKATGCSSCCKWTLGIFVLLGAIAGLLAYDTNIHGGKFESSATGKFLKDIGALPYVETAWTVSMKYSAKGFVWAENNVPVYYGKTRVVLGPYVDLSKDFSIIALNTAGKVWNNTKEIVNSKTPLVTDFIEQYAPGLPMKISAFASTACEFISTTSVQVYNGSCEFFRTKVLVGKLSPENLGKVMNCTQETAASYYSSFHDKVEYYAKLK